MWEHVDVEQKRHKNGPLGNFTSISSNHMCNYHSTQSTPCLSNMRKTGSTKSHPVFQRSLFHYFFYYMCDTMLLWSKCLISMKQTPSTRVSRLYFILTAVCVWEKEREICIWVPSVRVWILLTFMNRPTHFYVRTQTRNRSFVSAFQKWLTWFFDLLLLCWRWNSCISNMETIKEGTKKTPSLDNHAFSSLSNGFWWRKKISSLFHREKQQ